MLRAREGHSRWRWRRLQASLPLGAIDPGGSAASAPTTTWRGRAHDASPGHACKPSSIRPAHKDYKYTVQLTGHQPPFSVHPQLAGRLETPQQLLLQSTGSLACTMLASSMHASKIGDPCIQSAATRCYLIVMGTSSACISCFNHAGQAGRLHSPGGPDGGGIMEPRSQRLVSVAGGPPEPTPGGPPCGPPM